MLLVGLTGTLASGKSTTAAMFAEAGIPVFSADAAVHALYGGPAAAAIEAAFPGTTRNGTVDRGLLAKALSSDPQAIARLEAIVHPLVRDAETAFLDEALRSGAPLAVLEIPLLFETGGDARMDVVVVTTAPERLREERALERPRMTAETYRLLSARQFGDAEKQRRADYVVDTGPGFDAARREVRHIIDLLAARSVGGHPGETG